MRPKSVLAAAAAMTLAGGLSACGGSSGSSAAATSSVELTRAYTQTVAAKTADVTFSVKEETAGRTVQGPGTGSFDWGTREGSLDLQFQVPGASPTAGESFSFQEVVTAGAVYAKLPAQISKALGVAQPWVKIPFSNGSALSSGPDQALQLLISESSNVTRVGPATVDGVATTEYRADVNPTQAAANLPANLRATFDKVASTTGLTTIPMTVFVDSAGRAVRVSSTVTLTIPAGPSTGGSPQTETTVEQFDLSHFGAPVSVTLPPASEVGSSSKLNSLFGS